MKYNLGCGANAWGRKTQITRELHEGGNGTAQPDENGAAQPLSSGAKHLAPIFATEYPNYQGRNEFVGSVVTK
jgi:hypothetical protein